MTAPSASTRACAPATNKRSRRWAATPPGEPGQDRSDAWRIRIGELGRRRPATADTSGSPVVVGGWRNGRMAAPHRQRVVHTAGPELLDVAHLPSFIVADCRRCLTPYRLRRRTGSRSAAERADRSRPRRPLRATGVGAGGPGAHMSVHRAGGRPHRDRPAPRTRQPRDRLACSGSGFKFAGPSVSSDRIGDSPAAETATLLAP
jgi:hypothetical protein